ncbi:ABC-type transport system, involved in lipoprotein release, permease component [Clostridium pasteurianum DSM 525 = ATCC 6013]|uniref:ABC-type transport system, involved in lipoprotein release, permease component n=1 Tax=Clostridium pasteurianum DSM 525 = ATCC 6013 TaxID=1262449 RepID=A0A0H3IXG8_CLOPA|nr:ABC transporter permease [Clostridium pasteurianum]AJA46156.1 ABC-type transport system, involved in lipoprotein release, permease component [Clostridium pasteurianum DSM 525 = ATCC 6013]AJA50144.1 ABC-type transport system, involved in lipoprotein release, permease component [Clostridium pasteurianum DSM 525 = ATCC 6013]AOZ73616.1 ABC transporter permease [Clostridium pasteurianum DSM 525 = ATCC 6013]AOZ77413.1 ABC transporter permease [Clostridium pasteurianum]ELP57739.1 permease [Clostri
MKLVDCIKMAFSDLNKRKLRTTLTCFGIGVGALLVIVMAGLGQGIQTISNDQIKQVDSFRTISLNNSGNDSKIKKIDIDNLNKFKNINGVSEITASIDTRATEINLENKTAKNVDIVGNNLDFSIFTTGEKNEIKADKKKVKKYGSNPIIAGRIIEKNDSNSILIGQGLLNKLGIKDYKSIIGNTMEIKVSFPKIEGLPQKDPLVLKVEISGVVNKAFKNGGNIITASDELASKVQDYYMNSTDYLNKKGYTNAQIEANSMDNVSKVDDSIKKSGYTTQSQISYVNQMNNMMTIVKVLLTAAGVIVLLVASIGVINTMSMAVYEKTKSIGIMKAQGASRKNIRRMFVVQSGSLGFIGAAFGSIIALIIGTIVDKVLVMKQIAGFEEGMKIIDIRLSTIVFTILFTIVVAMIAGIIPARKAAKLNPVDSLRFE